MGLCSFVTCQLNVGFSFSVGGANWSPPVTLAGPMQLAWLPNTTSGRMVGDYISTSYSASNAFPVYADAKQPTPPPAFNEAMFTTPEAAFSPGALRHMGSDPVLASAADLAAHRWNASPLPTAN